MKNSNLEPIFSIDTPLADNFEIFDFRPFSKGSTLKAENRDFGVSVQTRRFAQKFSILYHRLVLPLISSHIQQTLKKINSRPIYDLLEIAKMAVFGFL